MGLSQTQTQTQTWFADALADADDASVADERRQHRDDPIEQCLYTVAQLWRERGRG
jgi:hypothetical protein